jgi:hypothetical protein
MQKSSLHPRELCDEREQLAAQYLMADTAYTKNLVSMKDAPENLVQKGNRIMDDLRKYRDIALTALLAHTQKHGC